MRAVFSYRNRLQWQLRGSRIRLVALSLLLGVVKEDLQTKAIQSQAPHSSPLNRNPAVPECRGKGPMVGCPAEGRCHREGSESRVGMQQVLGLLRLTSPQKGPQNHTLLNLKAPEWPSHSPPPSPRNLFLPVDSAKLAGRSGGGLTNLQRPS